MALKSGSPIPEHCTPIEIGVPAIISDTDPLDFKTSPSAIKGQPINSNNNHESVWAGIICNEKYGNKHTPLRASLRKRTPEDPDEPGGDGQIVTCWRINLRISISEELVKLGDGWKHNVNEVFLIPMVCCTLSGTDLHRGPKYQQYTLESRVGDNYTFNLTTEEEGHTASGEFSQGPTTIPFPYEDRNNECEHPDITSPFNSIDGTGRALLYKYQHTEMLPGIYHWQSIYITIWAQAEYYDPQNPGL